LNRYFVEIAFDGTNYHGWQTQPNGITVQEIMDRNLSLLLKEPVKSVGAGRTDAGVHATQFYFHFDTHKNIQSSIPGFVYKLNQLIPDDISVKNSIKVPDNLHARFDAEWRIYRYFISRYKNPFNYKYSWYCNYKFDLDIMNSCNKILLNNTDFTSFSKLHTDVKTNNCKIFNAEWKKNERDHLIIFEIKADRFLRNMVRAIVGTIIEVGRNKMTIDDFKEIIHKKDRNKAGMSVPAKGLFLTEIKYGHKSLNHNKIITDV
jgi:tRNA pseudouridine38-40 synthase